MRIEDGEPVRRSHVLHDQVQEQGGLAAARGTDQMHMPDPLFGAH